MPMTWNAEADAKLFAAVMQVADVKLTGDNLRKIAEIMGDDCTPKAVTHRISKFKTLAKNGAGDDATTSGEKKGTPTKGKGKGGRASKKADTPVHGGEDDEEAASNDTKPKKTAAGGKRKKTEAVDEDEEAGGKKLKLEEDEF